jgi:hypothetical protein
MQKLENGKWKLEKRKQTACPSGLRTPDEQAWFQPDCKADRYDR